MPDRHAIVSASGAARWLRCTRAPRYEEQFPQENTPYSLAGTLAHSICELYARKKFEVMNTRTFNSRLKKLKDDPSFEDYMLTNAEIWVQYITDTAMTFSEKPFFDFEVEVDLSDYVPEGFGTSDAILIGGDRIHVIDFKNGQGVKVEAESNPQMMLYALGALKMYELIYGDSIKRVSMAIIQPRLSADASEWECTVEELKKWGESIRPLAQEAFDGTGEFEAGEHCKFCRGKDVCRARARHYAGFEEYVDVPIGSQLDPATLADYLNKGTDILEDADISRILTDAAGIVDWFNGIKEYAVKAILAGREIPGYKLIEGKSNRKWTDQDEAFQVLIASGIQEAMLYERKPLTLSKVEGLIGKPKFKKVVGKYVTKPKGAPTLVPESDTRPPYEEVSTSEFEEAVNGG